MSTPTELRVNGESLQQLYTQYIADAYVVNRRYQRKLVWSVSEKERLIDSVLRDLPIPLILLAEASRDGKIGYEIIDGLQRLNAIFAFVENEFAVGGEYFDLESLGDTKYLRDKGDLVQREPLMAREACLNLVNYQLPVSTYRSASHEEIDEVFRRINSSGQKLSFQEIRQAGVTSRVADLVRRVSAAVRGDATLGDKVPLSKMPLISITNRELDSYGIDEKNIFWIKEGILDRDSVRESRDEELVLDILLDMTLDPLATSGSEYRNAAYGRGEAGSATSAEKVEPRVQVLGADTLYDEFFKVKGVIDQVVDRAGKSWAELTITQQNPRGVPRYFQAVFIALHQIINRENMVVADLAGLTRELSSFWDRDLSVPKGGGNWGRNRKEPLYAAVKAALERHFTPSTNPQDAHRAVVAAEFESRLQMSLTEAEMFELKQGFCSLADSPALDANSLSKVLRTATAMANAGPGTVGYIFFGVADDQEDADRVKVLHGVDSLTVGSFLVTGTAHELTLLDRNIDEHLRWLSDFIRSSKVDTGFGDDLISTLMPFNYKDRLVWSLTVRAQAGPVPYDQKYYKRSSNSTLEIPFEDYGALFAKFSS